MLKHFLRRAVEALFSAAHHEQAIRILCDIFHAVGDQNDREAPFAVQCLYAIQNFIPPPRIEARSRLIEHKDLRFHGKYARNRDAALLSAREFKGRLLVKFLR